MAINISYPSGASEITVYSKTPPKYRNLSNIKIKTPKKITRSPTIFVEHGIMAHTPCGYANDSVFNLTMSMKTCCLVGFYKLESTISIFASQNTFAYPLIV